MKLGNYKYLLLYIFFLVPGFAQSQQNENLAIASINDAYLVRPNLLSFDLRLTRISEKWERFANATFQLSFIDSTLDYDNLEIKYVTGTSDLFIESLTGGPLPIDGYNFRITPYDSRFSIYVAGPYEYDYCQIIPKAETPADSGIRIGTFTIATKDSSDLPRTLAWTRPLDYYQTVAYKLEDDTYIQPELVWAEEDNNLEMTYRDTTNQIVKYEYDEDAAFRFLLDYFKVEYAGEKETEITWATIEEAFNRGFFIWRYIKPFGGGNTVYKEDYKRIFSYEDPPPTGDMLKGLGTTNEGKEYGPLRDSVEYRGEEYCYELWYESFRGDSVSIKYLATACCPIPNAVITYAQGNPNPFRDKTQLDYILADEVILTVKVYDALGSEVETLIDREYKKRGHYTDLYFYASEYAHQGLYEVIFIAYPVDDPSVELSRAVIKLQLIR